MKTATQSDYTCPTCGKVLIHIKPTAPVVHVAADEHRLMDHHLEAIVINHQPIWA